MDGLRVRLEVLWSERICASSNRLAHEAELSSDDIVGLL